MLNLNGQLFSFPFPPFDKLKCYCILSLKTQDRRLPTFFAQAGAADTTQNSVSVGVRAKNDREYEKGQVRKGGSVLRSSSETRGARRYSLNVPKG